MAKRKAATAGAGRQGKRLKQATTTQSFLWRQKDWKLKRLITTDVSLVVSRTDHKRLLVKKVLGLRAGSGGDSRPVEIWALAKLPACNRIVMPLLYSPSDPDPLHGTALFQYYPLGDLVQWKKRAFDDKNNKPVTESFIWRFFLQMGQALAFIQNQIGPERDQRNRMLHRDIKPMNFLVVDNGTTYPSFKLHDFDCAVYYRKSRANLPKLCGTFQWQPPENPKINTRAADIWALGACVHYLATGKPPTRDVVPFAIARYQANNNQHPDSEQGYPSPDDYYRARVPRRVTRINLSPEEQRSRGIGPNNYQYTDELNHWMRQCLRTSPRNRATANQLVDDMGEVATKMLKRMGGKSALVDIEVKFGVDA